MNTLEISSTQNDLVKYIVKLQNSKFRKDEGLILVDGEQTIDGFIEQQVLFKYFFTKKDSPKIKKVKTQNLVLVNDEILKKISTTKSKTDFVGVIYEPKIDRNIFKDFKKIALIDGIKDAGNLGTIIRSAVAFSIDGIILYGDCVDLYNSKTIRATAQNIFKIPIIVEKNIEFVKELKKNHTLISTVVDTDKNFINESFDNNFIIAFGSEAFGISDDILSLTDKKVTFVMDNQVESLNLGVCASIAFAFIRLKNKLQ